MAEEVKVEAEAPKAPVSETKSAVVHKAGGKKPVVLIVVVILLLCCCCSIIAGAIFLYQRGSVSIPGLPNTIIPGSTPPGFFNPVPNGTGSTGDTDDDYLSDIPSAQIPSGFPSDVPIFPGAKVVFGTKDAETGYVVSLAAKASAAEVGAYYKAELAKKGWNITSEQTFLGDIITAEKGNNELTVIVYDASDAGIDGVTSSISLSVIAK